jgi:hypothetical protein
MKDCLSRAPAGSIVWDLEQVWRLTSVQTVS